ncbi:MAG: hypothetical protein WC028_23815 [Candidatus Obscuribacterales bacterium]
MKLPSMPSLAGLRFSNWSTPMKWSVGSIVAIVVLGFLAYAAVFLYLLGGVLASIIGQFWPLMVGTVVAVTALGAAIGKRSNGNALRGAKYGAIYSTLAAIIVPLVVAIVTLVTWQA